MNHRRQFGVVTCALAGLLALSGCGDTSQATLEFETLDVDLGLLSDGRAVRQPFAFTVWSQGAVQIESATTDCCGPNLVGLGDLEGRVLEPGSTHSLELRIPQVKLGSAQQIVARIETTPPSPRPIVLTLKATLERPPTIHPNPAVAEAVLGVEGRPVCRMQATRLRSAELPPLMLDVSKSELGEFSIGKMTVESKIAGRPGKIPEWYVDKVTFDLVAPDLPVPDEMRFKIKLAWEGSVPASVHPVVVRLKHPYHAAVDHLFCGTLPAGGDWDCVVPLIRELDGIRIVDVKSDRDYLAATPGPDGRTLRVEIRDAPRTPGRFEGAVSLKVDRPDIPDFTIRVSGISATGE